MKQKMLLCLANLAVREAISPEAAGLVATRLNLVVPLVDLLVGERTLAPCSEINERNYANALGLVLPDEAPRVRPALLDEMDELRGSLDSYTMVGTQILKIESEAGLAEIQIDPLRAHLVEARAIILPAIREFTAGYGQPFNYLDLDLRRRVLALPLGLIAIMVTYIAKDHLVGLRRVAPLLRQIAQAMPIGVLDDESDLTWTIIVD
jgi:hypothetical protein